RPGASEAPLHLPLNSANPNENVPELNNSASAGAPGLSQSHQRKCEPAHTRIGKSSVRSKSEAAADGDIASDHGRGTMPANNKILICAVLATGLLLQGRSEERRVGKECRSRWTPDQ